MAIKCFTGYCNYIYSMCLCMCSYIRVKQLIFDLALRCGNYFGLAKYLTAFPIGFTWLCNQLGNLQAASPARKLTISCCICWGPWQQQELGAGDEAISMARPRPRARAVCKAKKPLP